MNKVFMRIYSKQLYIFVPSCFEYIMTTLCENLSTRVQKRSGRGYISEVVEAYSMTRREDGFEFLTYSGLIGIVKSILDNANIQFDACERLLKEDGTTADYRLNNLLKVKELPMPRYGEISHLLREWQVEAFSLFANCRFGCAKVSTGGGKSFLVKMFCWAASLSRICVTTAEVADLQVLYESIASMGLDVAWVKGRLRESQRNARVICVNTRSIHHVQDIRFDILFGDECQMFAGASYRSGLYKIYSRRTFGLSATVGQRSDKADMMVTGLFGPILIERTYEENKDAGDVVPIVYRFVSTRLSAKVKLNTSNAAVRYRKLIVQNEERNKIFADVAKFYLEQGHQVLIMTSTVEHTLRMWHLLPEAIGVYRSIDAKVINRIKADGKWSDRFVLRYTDATMQTAIDSFASGETRLAIANRVWWKAKNFPQLYALIRVDAMNTDEASIQIAGRLSRKCPEIAKTHGLLIDGEDSFDNTTQENSRRRKSKYNKMGWKPWDQMTDGDQLKLF